VPPDQKVDISALKRRSARGGVITLVSQGLTIAIQLASTIVLARLLSPADYGIIAMVLAVTNFAGVFRDLGLSSATIQKKDLTFDQQTNLFWLNVGMGGILTLLVSAASPLVVWFYGKPELLWVTVALSFNFLISSLASQHGALLVRNMEFCRSSVPAIVGAVAGLGMSVLLALQGWSYWALVWGNLSASTATTLLLFALSPLRPGRLTRRSGVREMLKFGINVSAYDFVNYFHRNFDNILIGRFVGASALGLYSRAYALLMLPINSLRGPITSVGFPALSRLQDQAEAFRDYYRRLASILALVAMPLTAFLYAQAEDIIRILLGQAWLGVVPIFSVLAIVAFIQPVLTLWGVVVLSRGMGRRYLSLGIFNTICSVLGFLCGLPWGAIGVATGYAIVIYATAVPTLLWAFRGTPVSLKDFIESTARPALASVVGAACTLFVARYLADTEIAVKMLMSLAVFLTLYTTIVRLLPGGKDDFALVGKFFAIIGNRVPRHA